MAPGDNQNILVALQNREGIHPRCVKQAAHPSQKGTVNGVPWFWGRLVICLSPKGRKQDKHK